MASPLNRTGLEFEGSLLSYSNSAAHRCCCCCCCSAPPPPPPRPCFHLPSAAVRGRCRNVAGASRFVLAGTKSYLRWTYCSCPGGPSLLLSPPPPPPPPPPLPLLAKNESPRTTSYRSPSCHLGFFSAADLSGGYDFVAVGPASFLFVEPAAVVVAGAAGASAAGTGTGTGGGGGGDDVDGSEGIPCSRSENSAASAFTSAATFAAFAATSDAFQVAFSAASAGSSSPSPKRAAMETEFPLSSTPGAAGLPAVDEDEGLLVAESGGGGRSDGRSSGGGLSAEETKGKAMGGSAAAHVPEVAPRFETTGVAEPDIGPAEGGALFAAAKGAAALACCGKSTAAIVGLEVIGGGGGGRFGGDDGSRVPRFVLFACPSISPWRELGDRGLFLPIAPPPPPPPLLPLTPLTVGLAPWISPTLAASSLRLLVSIAVAGAAACVGVAISIAGGSGGGGGMAADVAVAADTTAATMAASARPTAVSFCTAPGPSLSFALAAGCIFDRFAGELAPPSTSPASTTAAGVPALEPPGPAVTGRGWLLVAEPCIT